MGTDIDNAYVQSFKGYVELKYQQMTSRLQGRVRVEMQQAETDFYDRIAPTSMVQITTRHEATGIIPTTYDRRACRLKDYKTVDLIDKADKIRMLANPENAYLKNFMAALGRQIDTTIYAQAVGTAYSDKNGLTPVTFPGAQQVPVNFVETGSTVNSGLTIPKLRRALTILRTAEAVEPGETITCACSYNQINDLLQTTEVTNADYNTLRALQAGQVDSFMGINFVHTEVGPVTAATGGNRTVILFPQKAIVLAMGMSPVVRVTEESTRNFSVQVYLQASFDAVRMWEQQVVSILCLEP